MTVPPFRGSGPLMNLLGLSPVVAILVGVRMHRPASPGPWRWFAVGFVLFWFGDLYTYSYPLLLDGDVPFPSLGRRRLPARLPGADDRPACCSSAGAARARDRGGVIDGLILTVGLVAALRGSR